jgi:hypothetical protein
MAAVDGGGTRQHNSIKLRTQNLLVLVLVLDVVARCFMYRTIGVSVVL